MCVVHVYGIVIVMLYSIARPDARVVVLWYNQTMIRVLRGTTMCGDWLGLTRTLAGGRMSEVGRRLTVS